MTTVPPTLRQFVQPSSHNLHYVPKNQLSKPLKCKLNGEEVRTLWSLKKRHSDSSFNQNLQKMINIANKIIYLSASAINQQDIRSSSNNNHQFCKAIKNDWDPKFRIHLCDGEEFTGLNAAGDLLEDPKLASECEELDATADCLFSTQFCSNFTQSISSKNHLQLPKSKIKHQKSLQTPKHKTHHQESIKKLHHHSKTQ